MRTHIHIFKPPIFKPDSFNTCLRDDVLDKKQSIFFVDNLLAKRQVLVTYITIQMSS